MNLGSHILIGTVLAAMAMVYSVIAWWATFNRRRSAHIDPSHLPAITVLKPLCGADGDLYGCLRTSCDQSYPRFQIIFGVRDEHDPAIAVVHRLQADFPHADLMLVIDRRQHGSNRKVSNLINMLPHARYDYLVMVDSDVRVPRDHLARLAGPLMQQDIGVVTCAYRGVPHQGPWSLLGSLIINDWFMPMVRIDDLSGSCDFVSGVTIAMRRSVLAAIGGLERISDQLADDYRLGELTRTRGLRTVLSDVVVDTCVNERSFTDLVRHQLRWLRTIRAIRPLGYSLSGLTFNLPIAIVGVWLASAAHPAMAMLAITVVARVMLHCAGRRAASALLELWAVPLCDLLVIALWCWGFVSRRVHWRQDFYWIGYDGSVKPLPHDEPTVVSEQMP